MRVRDWAQALSKSTKMRVGKRKGAIGEYRKALTPSCLRALMRYQHGLCAVSKLRICLPGDAVLFGPNATLKGWLESLSPEEEARTPVLVRHVSTGHWEPGNVVFIVKCLEPFYTAMDGAYGMKPIAARMCDTLPPDVPQLSMLRKLIREER